MESNEAQNLWSRFKKCLGKAAPELLDTLQPGATAKQIASAEAHFSVQFPEAFIAFYRIHNGQAAYADGIIEESRELLSLERMQEEWNGLKSVFEDSYAEEEDGAKGSVDQKWWLPQWLPITSDGNGNFECLDLSLTGGDQAGQIIDYWHDDPSREVTAKSFADWLLSFVQEYERVEAISHEEKVEKTGPVKPVDVKAWLKEEFNPGTELRWPFGNNFGVK